MAPGPERRAAPEVDRAEPYSEKDKEAAHARAGSEEPPAAACPPPTAAAALPPPPADEPAAAVLPPPPTVDEAAQQKAAFQAAIAQAAAAAAAAAARLAAQAAQAKPAVDSVQQEGQPFFVKVSATGNLKQVAGKVAHTCRGGDAPALLGTGSVCINQAVKAVAISRSESRIAAGQLPTLPSQLGS
jgi:stage V sporulation protein SpoVS